MRIKDLRKCPKDGRRLENQSAIQREKCEARSEDITKIGGSEDISEVGGSKKNLKRMQ